MYAFCFLSLSFFFEKSFKGDVPILLAFLYNQLFEIISANGLLFATSQICISIFPTCYLNHL